MTQKPLGISIIIPNYNGAHFLDSCLTSLLTSIKITKGTNFEIILVDNASSDNSVNLFNSTLSGLKSIGSTVITLKTNTGFAYAVNRGIEASRFDYVCVCNNDLTMDKSWFPQIISTIQSNNDQKITTFFGLVLNKEGTKIESRGLRFYPYGKAENIDNGKPYTQSNKSGISPPHLIWGASASVVVYHKPTILKVGLFDQRFFAYEEDVDLAYRLNQSGYKTLFIPAVVSNHLGGGTSSKMGNFRQQHDFKNWILLIAKNYSFRQILQNSPAIFIERLRNLSGLIKATSPHQVPHTVFRVISLTVGSLFESPLQK